MGPLQVRTVHGETIRVGDRTLTPVVRTVSFGRVRAKIGGRGYGGWGGGFAKIQPIAMLEETPNGWRRIRIVDGTSDAVRRRVLLALGITVVFAALRRLIRRVER